MVEQRLSVRDEHLRKGNSEEADTIVARYLPKVPKSLRTSSSPISSLKLSISLLWSSDRSGPSPASVHSHPLHNSFSICIALRPAGPWCPLYVTYVAFSLYHTPLQDASGSSLVAVNVLPPNPYFSTYISPIHHR